MEGNRKEQREGCRRSYARKNPGERPYEDSHETVQKIHGVKGHAKAKKQILEDVHRSLP
jgi:hypothetical protein